MTLSRRRWLQSLAALPAAPAGLRFATAGPDDGDVLLCIFQRGGVDGLNMVVPYGDPDYYAARPALALPPPGQPGGVLDLDGFFGLHPALAALQPLYQTGVLAAVHATGSPHPTRSHFDAMDFMERALLMKGGVFSGWLGRHLESSGLDPQTAAPFQAVGMGGSLPTSLRGEGLLVPVAIADLERFGLDAGDDAYRAELERLFDGDGPLYAQARQALAAAATLEAQNLDQYRPENGAQYPDSEFGQTLLQVGQLLKAEDLGVRVVCADIGGWDTHNQQAATLNALLADLGDSLAALYTDLGSRTARLCVVTMSEFGRRVAENGSAGTDHGHGNCMLLLGGGVNGGRVYADWPGLAPAQLFAGADLEVSIDWRTVLGELVAIRLNNGDALESIFPDYPMPAFVGAFRTRGQPQDGIFSDGFG